MCGGCFFILIGVISVLVGGLSEFWPNFSTDWGWGLIIIGTASIVCGAGLIRTSKMRWQLFWSQAFRGTRFGDGALLEIIKSKEAAAFVGLAFVVLSFLSHTNEWCPNWFSIIMLLLGASLLAYCSREVIIERRS